MEKSSRLDFRILEYDRVTSTNDLLKDLAQNGAREGTVIIASSQTGGRGRGVGRRFYSPEGSGLYMSLLLRPNGGAENSLGITTAAAVAVCRAIVRETGKEPKIKWVNDIIVDGKKVCGILTEAAFSSAGTGLDYAVLGIGINLFSPKEGFPEDIKDIAGALCDVPVTDLRQRLARSVLEEFKDIYLGGMSDHMKAYRRFSCVIGREVRVYRSPFALTAEPDAIAYAYGIDDECRLLIRYPDGREEALFSGEISVRY